MFLGLRRLIALGVGIDRDAIGKLRDKAAIEMYQGDVLRCLIFLQEEARRWKGLDYLQVFEDPMKPEPLWFIEDGDGGAITALLPSDY